MKLRLADGSLDLTNPIIMGVLNCTPDSFSDGGRYNTLDNALRHAEAMIKEGAGIIDIGGESTRPGAPAVPLEEELDRVIPVLERLTREFDAPVSVDTSKTGVMREALAAGAAMINDVTALSDEGAIQVCADAGTAVCLMHMQGTPRTMQEAPEYDDVLADVVTYLSERAAACEAGGIDRDAIVIDPGFGFGKTVEHNLQLLAGLGRLVDTGYPVLAGLSRKSMIGKILGRDVDDRLVGSVVLALLAAQNGAHIIRVHDVAETADALKVAGAVAQAL